MKTLAEGDFLDRAENVLAFGNPGSGKTHLLCAIGQELLIAPSDDLEEQVSVFARRRQVADLVDDEDLGSNVVAKPPCIATSKEHPYPELILSQHSMRDLFSSVTGATFDGKRRYKADIVAHAIQAAAISADSTVMVGDRAKDIHAGQNQAMATIAVTNGFGRADELGPSGADAVIDDFETLLGVH